MRGFLSLVVLLNFLLMKKEEIIQKMQERHQAFFKAFAEMSDDDFVLHFEEKWSPGQHLLHMYRSVKALGQARMVPNFVIKQMYGSAKVPSLSYEDLVQRYQNKLAKGGKATGKYIPPEVVTEQKTAILEKFRKEIAKLNGWIAKFSEKQLDTLMLPHPLIGKITLREMLYFTLHHVRHHHEIVFRDLELAKNHN